MTKILELVSWFDSIAPHSLAAPWDNTGLLMGDAELQIKKVLVCLTLTSDVALEAIDKKIDLIVTHHPLPFKPLNKITTSTVLGKILWKLANKGIGVYSLHTRWDDAVGGINDALLNLLGAKSLGPIVTPDSNDETKLVTFVPEEVFEKVAEALFNAGAGKIGNYSQCSFYNEGTGTFFGNELSNPMFGKKGQIEKVKEIRLEVICPNASIQYIIDILMQVHPYEEPVYDLFMLKPKPSGAGSGRLGLLQKPLSIAQIAKKFTNTLNLKKIQFAGKVDLVVSKVAVVCGSGAALMGKAFSLGAECFITGEARFHDLLEAKEQNKGILMLGHYESEKPGIEKLATDLGMAFPALQVFDSEVEQDPLISF